MGMHVDLQHTIPNRQLLDQVNVQIRTDQCKIWIEATVTPIGQGLDSTQILSTDVNF
jgi:hypothetical protein